MVEKRINLFIISSLINKDSLVEKKFIFTERKKTQEYIGCGIIRMHIQSVTMIVTIVLLIVLICLIVGYVWTLTCRYDYFKRRGLSGPPPILFFGHYRILWSLPDLSEQLRRWTEEYGSIYGLFEGTRPMYVVSDVDFLYEVFVKQFASFNIRSIPFLMKKVRGHQVHMFGASGPTWRRQRYIINPTFSTTKLRLMSSQINHCIQSLLHILKNNEKNGEQFNIYEIYRRLTMDIICKYNQSRTFSSFLVFCLGRCAFGMDTDMQNDSDSIIMRKCKLAVDENPERLFLTKVGNLMPFLIPILPYIMIGQTLLGTLIRAVIPTCFMPQIEEIPAIWILNQVKTIINIKRQVNYTDKRHQVDLLQLMLNAITCDDIKVNCHDILIQLFSYIFFLLLCRMI